MSKIIRYHAIDDMVLAECELGGQHWVSPEDVMYDGRGEAQREQPDWVCSYCGEKYGRGWPEGHLGTWHTGTCGVCGREASVTQPRDFGYLNMDRVNRDKAALAVQPAAGEGEE